MPHLPGSAAAGSRRGRGDDGIRRARRIRRLRRECRPLAPPRRGASAASRDGVLWLVAPSL